MPKTSFSYATSYHHRGAISPPSERSFRYNASQNFTSDNSAPISGGYVPSLGTTVQNLLISIGTLFSSVFSLWVTFVILLPLSLLKFITPSFIWSRITSRWSRSPSSQSRLGANGRRVILVLDASNGLGFGIASEYFKESNTTVIPASEDEETLRELLLDYRAANDIQAEFQCKAINLSAPRKQLSEALKHLDKELGPITHFYVVPPTLNQTRGTDKVSNGSALNGTTDGHLHKETHAAGRQVVSSTDDFLATHVSGVVTATLTVFELMKGRGYGAITIAAPVSESSVASTLKVYGYHHTFKHIAAFSASAFLRTFATSLHFLASEYGVDIVSAAIDPTLGEHHLARMRGLSTTEKDAYTRSHMRELAAKIVARSELSSPPYGYYHDHAYVASIDEHSILHSTAIHLTRGAKFNPLVEGIAAWSLNWYAGLNPKAIAKKVNSKIKDAVKNVEKKGVDDFNLNEIKTKANGKVKEMKA